MGGVFKAAAVNNSYWDQEVRRPAINYLARGRAGAVPMVSVGTRGALSNVDAALGLPAGSALDDRRAGGRVVRPPGAGLSKGARWRAKGLAKLAGALGRASPAARHKAQGQQRSQKARPEKDE